MKDYKKILEGVANIINSTEKSDIGFADICAYIGENCPELKESEDERIRKHLIKHFRNKSKEDWNGVPVKSVLAWLEKQGEQKPTDTVKPKFHEGDVMRTLQEAADNITSGLPVVVSIDEEYYHCNNELIAIKDQDDYEYPPMNRIQTPTDKVKPRFHEGDWLVINGFTILITDVRDGLYHAMFVNGECRIYDADETNVIDKEAHLWDIAKDAKDGDVLVEGEGDAILMFRRIGKWDDIILYHCYYDCYRGDFNVQEDGSYWGNAENNQLKPATKEQRDTLFASMKEAGYEWDADKKELKKIEQHPAEWSEEDERMVESILADIQYCKKAYDNYSFHDTEIAWLRSLKERHTWKPSDEHYELEEFAKIVRGNLTGISKAVQDLFEVKYLQLTGKKMYGGFKD